MDSINNQVKPTIEVNGWGGKKTNQTKEQFLVSWDICTMNDLLNLIIPTPSNQQQTAKLLKLRDEFNALKRQIVSDNFDAVLASQQRQAKVTSIKSQINEGTYTIDLEKVAESFATVEGLGIASK